ncbi:hypothetical protein ACFLSQ_01970 [Bacteroidota bacterium]
MNSIKKIWSGSNISLIIGIAILLAYSAYYIILNSYIIDGVRYYSLFDDAMVSMRYAENIANGQGPVWNPGGDAVEGFSNPLWTYIMALVHLLPIAKAQISLVMQISVVVILGLNLYFIKKSMGLLSGNNVIITGSAVILTACYLPLNNWAIQGMEVSLIALILSAGFYITLKNLNGNKFSHLQLILPAIAIWVRMDAVLIYLVFFVFLYSFDKENRRIIFRTGILSLIISLAILFIWRNYYFGEWLPNTYYLKMTGYPLLNRLGKGFYAFAKFMLYMTPIIFALPFWLYFKTKKTFLLLPLSIMLIMILYSIYVGGDSWEWWLPANRFISSAMPLFIIMVCLTIRYIIAIFEHKGKIKKARANTIFIILIFISILAFNFNSWEYLKGELLLTKTFTEKDNSNQTRLALEAKKILKKDAEAAVAMAGVLPYFLERRCIDLLGKNDKAIARMPVFIDSSLSYLNYNPGHMKWNYSYSIGKLNPDAVLQLWNNPITAMPYLSDDYIAVELAGFNVFLRKGSEKIRWEKIGKF